MPLKIAISVWDHYIDGQVADDKAVSYFSSDEYDNKHPYRYTRSYVYYNKGQYTFASYGKTIGKSVFMLLTVLWPRFAVQVFETRFDVTRSTLI